MAASAMMIDKRFFVRQRIIFAVIPEQYFKKIIQSITKKSPPSDIADVIEQFYSETIKE